VHFTPQPGSNETVDAHVDPERVAWAQRARTLHPYDPAAPFGIPAVMRSGRTEFWPVIDLAAAKELMTHTEGFHPGDLAEILDQLGVTSLMTIPLTTKRGVVGVIQFASAESRRQFDEYDLALAEAAAGRIAEALDNAWLLEQQRTIASTLQAALLPDRLPDLPGITIAARYWAAGAVSEVGGDFYDVFPIGDRRWAVVIGDVCGTGPRAAAVTAVARHTIRAAATHGEDHVSVLTWVNDAILNGDSDLFCTVLYSTLELLDDGTWMFTSAAGGHPLPVLVAPDGSASSIGPYGTLIGVLPEISVTPTSTILRPGSTIMLHTDGVNDVAPPHDLDAKALEQLVASAAEGGGTADDIAERIGASIASTLPIPDRDDDVAIVVITLDRQD
jgi:serine phosphatase RsbU (regulator of sigma subunit)